VLDFFDMYQSNNAILVRLGQIIQMNIVRS